MGVRGAHSTPAHAHFADHLKAIAVTILLDFVLFGFAREFFANS
jgi:hypothetical protein